MCVSGAGTAKGATGRGFRSAQGEIAWAWDCPNWRNCARLSTQRSDRHPRARSRRPSSASWLRNCRGSGSRDKARSHIEHLRAFVDVGAPLVGAQPGRLQEPPLLVDIPVLASRYRAAHPHLRTSTCNRRIAWLRRIGRLAHRRWGWLARPVYLELPPEHNERQRYLSLAEVKRLLAACDHGPTRDAVILAVCTGLRQGQIFGLNQANVRGNCLWLPGSKNGKPISKNGDPLLIPIVAPMIDAVLRLPLPCKARTMYTHYKRACRRAGFEDLTFHDLRHTTASLVIDAGYSIKIVQEVLGHRSVQAADRYAHLSVGAKREALERVFGG